MTTIADLATALDEGTVTARMSAPVLDAADIMRAWHRASPDTRRIFLAWLQVPECIEVGP